MEQKPENVHYKYGVYCARFAVDPCNNGYAIKLTETQYREQMSNEHVPWVCPICGGLAQWDTDSTIIEDLTDGHSIQNS